MTGDGMDTCGAMLAGILLTAAFWVTVILAWNYWLRKPVMKFFRRWRP